MRRSVLLPLAACCASLIALSLLVAQPRPMMAQIKPGFTPAPTPVPSPPPRPTGPPATAVPGPTRPPPQPNGAPTPAATPAPEPTGPGAAAAAAAAVVHELGLREGTILFNPPTDMTVGVPEQIRAVVTTQEISADLVNGLRGRGVVRTETILVGSVMKVRLSGEGFHITPLTAEEQPIADRMSSDWAWEVRPVDGGDQTLYLVADAVVRLNGSNVNKTVRVLDRTIKVQVNPLHSVREFWSDNWKWIVTFAFGSSLGPFFVWLWARRPRRRSHRGRPA